MSGGDYIVVTHTDIDGVGSASLYIYLQETPPKRIVFSEPYTLDKALNKIGIPSVDKIAIMDLGMNPRIMDRIIRYIEKISSSGIAIEWYDHHVWDNEWIETLRKLGVKAFIDRSTCATGVIAKYAPRKRSVIDESFIEEFVAGVCAGDLWRFDHWRGPWYLRLVRRRDSHRWRLHVIEVLSRGVLWSDEFTDVIVRRLEKELLEFKRLSNSYIIREINGVRVTIAPSSDSVDNSFVAAYIMGRTDADIAAIISRDGKLSLRSRRINVREIAKRLGGGGHVRAAGAKLKLPLITRLKALFNQYSVLEYASKKIYESLLEIGIDNIRLT